MRLTALLEGLSYRILAGPLDPEVCELVHNHQEVRPKAAFVAIQGARFDGHAFVPEAIQRGAGAVIVERPVEVPPEVTVVQLEDTRRALSLLAANRYGHPANSLVLVGVTGTNGKTSVTYLVQSLFARRGYACSRIGTIAYEIGGELLSAGTTTPDALELQRLLRRAVDRGSQAVVMEVSSHALVQHRVAALQFDVAVWTNLTQDHLDFHQTMEAYRDAKLLLFRRHLKPSGLAVLNRDDPLYPAFRTAAEEAGAQRITFGRDGSADVRAEAVELTPTETRFLLRWNDKAQPVRLRLLGIFSVWNALAAAAVGLGMGWELPEIVEAIESVPGVPGRFEPVHAGQPFGVVVDYAHTPDALKNLLEGARSLRPQRVICVFGCGGDRDRAKRPIMGRIAAELADLVILTSDNPRTEDPIRILQEIEEGIPNGTSYLVIPDREEAIRHAVGKAQEGDLILIAGKGHEDYQIVGDRRLPFDDREVAQKVLLERFSA